MDAVQAYIYHIQCILYLPDAIQSISTRLRTKLSTPVDGVSIGLLHEAEKSV